MKGPKNIQKSKKVRIRSKSSQFAALENQLIEILGTKVRLRYSKKGGNIEIFYFSDDDLERIIDLLNTIA